MLGFRTTACVPTAGRQSLDSTEIDLGSSAVDMTCRRCLPPFLVAACWRYPLLQATHVSSTTGIAWRARKWVGGYGHRMGMVVEPMQWWAGSRGLIMKGSTLRDLHCPWGDPPLTASPPFSAVVNVWTPCCCVHWFCREIWCPHGGVVVLPTAVDTSALMMMVSKSVVSRAQLVAKLFHRWEKENRELTHT